MNSQIQDRLLQGLHFVSESEKVISARYQDPRLKVELKRDRTVVTEADKEAEATLRTLIQARFPSDAIIGEELGEIRGTSGFSWILDPIDGTQAFVCGVPLFGTLIGVTYHDEPVAGIVNMPALKETYYGSKGQGAWWKASGAAEPARARVSSVESLSESLFCTTSHSGFDRAGRHDLFDSLLTKTKKFRGWGSCYGHMLVATGRADLMVDPDVSLWDCAAIFPIVTEAGGHFFDIKGRRRIDGGSAVSCASQLYEPLIELLR